MLLPFYGYKMIPTVREPVNRSGNVEESRRTPCGDSVLATALSTERGHVCCRSPLPNSARSAEDVGQETLFDLGGQRLGGSSDDPNGSLAQIYAEVRAMAVRLMRDQRGDSLLQATDLANETCLKLIGHERLTQGSRRELLNLASAAMRNLLVDRARHRSRLKRCPKSMKITFEELTLAYEDRAVNLVALDEALQKLNGFDPEMAKAVELRFFCGLSMEETANHLEIPLRTFERRWEVTRRWLRKEIG